MRTVGKNSFRTQTVKGSEIQESSKMNLKSKTPKNAIFGNRAFLGKGYTLNVFLFLYHRRYSSGVTIEKPISYL